jgi:hypothetical protein
MDTKIQQILMQRVEDFVQLNKGEWLGIFLFGSQNYGLSDE